MIAALLVARERDDFVAAVRALDRILMSGFYVVPLFHLPDQWVARWTTISTISGWFRKHCRVKSHTLSAR